MNRDIVTALVGLIAQGAILVVSIATGQNLLTISTCLVMLAIITFSISSVYKVDIINKKIFTDQE